MKRRFPALFLSHGAPSIVIEDCPARHFLQQLGTQLGRPKGIVAVSAHWCTAEPRVTMHPQPPTLHDFGGFADELHAITYNAPGDPVMAKKVLNLLAQAGIPAEKDMSRGFDHGTWAPLVLIYPDAGIPVIQLSVQPHRGTDYHLALGKALAPLRDEEILIVASGSATHNLRDLFGRGLNAGPLPYAREFNDWLAKAVTDDATEELCDYLRKAPHATQNHPSPEHLLPLFVAMGSGGTGRLLHDSFTYGVISMAAFAWE